MGTTSERQVWIRRGAVIAAAILVAVVAFILISDGDDDGSGGQDAVEADADEILELASDLGHEAYWAGPTGDTYEWTALEDGRVYVRYLTGDAEAGDPRPLFTTVATYPVGNGVAAVKKAAQGEGNRTIRVPGGATALVSPGASSVYLAYPGSEYQIEVFDPDPARALQLVRSGRIQPIP